MSYARRTDTPHAELVKNLRRLGWLVHDCSRVGGGFFDAILGKGGRIVFAEFKNGDRPPSRRRLRPKQVTVHDAFLRAGAEVVVLESLDDLQQLERPVVQAVRP